MMITIYSKPACAQCKATYAAFDKLGAQYTILDVTADDSAMDRVVELGFYQAPVVEAGELSWSGFRPDLIMQAFQQESGSQSGQNSSQFGSVSAAPVSATA
jgi:glutaredoxin-like protein NrdH